MFTTKTDQQQSRDEFTGGTGGGGGVHGLQQVVLFFVIKQKNIRDKIRYCIVIS